MERLQQYTEDGKESFRDVCNFSKGKTLGQNNNTTALESVQKFDATECNFRRGLKIVSARENCYKADYE